MKEKNPFVTPRNNYFASIRNENTNSSGNYCASVTQTDWKIRSAIWIIANLISFYRFIAVERILMICLAGLSVCRWCFFFVGSANTCQIVVVLFITYFNDFFLSINFVNMQMSLWPQCSKRSCYICAYARLPTICLHSWKIFILIFIFVWLFF